MSYNKPKTIFCDIDGTLLKHHGDCYKQIREEAVLLEETIEKLVEWDRKGYNIILVTGRRESMREITEKQLKQLGVFYDRMIMGLGGGTRVLINDKKVNSAESTAVAINIKRNEGLKNVEI